MESQSSARRCIFVGLITLLACVPASKAQPCDPCDTNCDAIHDTLDIAPFVDTLLNAAAGCSPCSADVNADGLLDGNDLQPFINCLTTPPLGACCDAAASCSITTQSACTGLWFGPNTTCSPSPCISGNLTAYRPQNGTGYFPFSKTAVPESSEDSLTLGPGIRINAPGDADLAGEDDLIEILVETTQPAIPIALSRNNASLRVWTTRTKSPGTEITFTSNKTGALPMGAQSSLTLWVEWAIAQHGDALLNLEPLAATFSLDTLRFHTFHSIVMALGGEGQTPTVPVDPNQGTFVIGIDLYNQGYDVHMHDEDDVTADGSGPSYDEIVDAITHRLIDKVSIYGYSHGGGSTYDLSERLDNNRAGIGVFDIVVTSYVDSVQNDSDFDVDQELRRPPSTGYHANHYQVGTLADFFLDGGPVPNSFGWPQANPTPNGLNVETTPWGTGATHFLVDDYAEVKSFMEDNLISRLVR